jgi:glycosyltransferase involved in cell wall biosynthesis
MSMLNPKKIAIFVSFSGEGGVERMIAHLCEGFLALGVAVDLLLIKDRGSALKLVPAAVNQIKLGDHATTCLPRLIAYLRRERPAALLSSKHRANQIAILARALAGVETRLLVKIETNLTASLAKQNPFKRFLFTRQLRLFYPHADGVIGVSQGVTDDLHQLIGGDPARFHTVYNPVLPKDLESRAREPIAHPWFGGSVPVVIGAGRLTRQKDFATLLHALALVLQERPARLLLLGDGPERARLEALAAELGISAVVDFYGFVANPFPYIARSDLFALSSAWEGFGNVLVEAMALGVPVVSTDCPSGPREILHDGALGPLVPVADPAALATAIVATLAAPLSRPALMAATGPYTIPQSAREHLTLLLADPATRS